MYFMGFSRFKTYSSLFFLKTKGIARKIIGTMASEAAAPQPLFSGIGSVAGSVAGASVASGSVAAGSVA